MRRCLARSFFGLCIIPLTLVAQVNPNLYAGLQWRSIGPFRSGRISAVTGVSGQPGVYYVGLPGGGVWKTVSAGATWFPVFDAITSVSSIGAVAVAPSDPNVIYVGTGDLITGGAINEGDGLYKSTDAGKSWTHLGLDDTRQIPVILVDPHDANIVLVAAQGNVHASSEDGRGIFRSTDGGAHFDRVFVKDAETGIQDLAWAYDNPKIILATTVRHYNAPPNPNAPGGGRGGRGGGADGSTAIYKSTDEGLTWKPLEGGGLPPLSGRTSVAVAAHTNGQRAFLVGTFGLYRSDDGGASWTKSTSDTRAVGSSYICDVYVDTKDPDTVYVMNTSMYQSTDGGHTFIAYKGAPGGDDNHVLWIDPADHQRILMGSDQGATISFDEGHTWSQWWNLPNAQVYHIATDNRFPYWVYATQQDTGAIGTRTRGDFGEITPFDWWPLAGYEFGYVAVSPLDPNIVYIGSQGGGVSKIVQPSGQWSNIAPNQGRTDYRKVTNNPIVFSPVDPHTLYVGTQYVTVTTDDGMHWKNLSPDLSLRAGAAAAPAGGRGGAALETIAPSPVSARVIWAGSNNGLIHRTSDAGATWPDVTPGGLPPTADISMLEASHFDPATAYAAVDEHGSGDYSPYIYRTRDSGKSWEKIVSGLPTDLRSGSFVRVVREDPKKRGLLFAGTESSVYVSFDDGDHWQSLRQNLPTTSYRDLIVHGNDLVVGTYGRAFWVLDDISPLRQLTPAVAASTAYLFKPGDAIRTRWSVMANMPFTPEMPHADNPPFGAIFYYYLNATPVSAIKLEVLDAQGKLVRTLSSAPLPPIAVGRQAIPDYWMAHPRPMPTAVGTNRYTWDFRYEPPPALTHSYEATEAVYQNTPLSPEAPFAMPGIYTLKLTVDGHVSSQTLKLVNDPRIGQAPAEMAALTAQHNLEMQIVGALDAADAGYQQITKLRGQINALVTSQLSPELAASLTAFDAKLGALAGAAGGGRRGGGAAQAAGRGAAAPASPALSAELGTFNSLLTLVGAADRAPTAPQVKAYRDYCGDLHETLTAWASTGRELTALNATLTQAHLQPLATGAPPPAPACAQ